MKSTALFLLLAVALSPFSFARAEEAPAAPAASAPEEATKVSTLPYERKSPILAGALSLIPGLGQMYNGSYFLGGMLLASEAGLYTAALAYLGVFDPSRRIHMGVEAVFFFALAGGLHLFSIFDATMEAVRINENLDRFQVAYNPDGQAFMLAYRVRF
ncbi:MAG: hypothetical protein GYA21_01175 [Myxococcales bacterium]|nr:hypothetical protein [Myxococcales bacterium]